MVFVGYYCCHSLRGLCGLKSVLLAACPPVSSSQPARAVWIEIIDYLFHTYSFRSQPARAVWIEIQLSFAFSIDAIVTACEGCVD